MISYKYKLYRNKQTKHLGKMLREAAFVWNHALALQKRYYSLYNKYIPCNALQKHFAKRLKPTLLHSQTQQEVIQRLDTAYQRFFKHIATRPPKFKKAEQFTSFVFKQGGYTLQGNKIGINKLHRTFKFSLSRHYEGNIKRLVIKRSHLNEFYLVVITDKQPNTYGKSHNGASVGIDFGLKTYMTMSDGTVVKNPQFLKGMLIELKVKSKKLSKTKKASHNHERKRKDIVRFYEKIMNKRSDFQWKLAHDLCKRYDYIFIEDLNLSAMARLWGRKVNDLAHGDFLLKLMYVASKYGVTVHKIDRWYPSSKQCTCGYVYKDLKLYERQWTCPHCGEVHDRDFFAAQNIHRKGISDLKSEGKSCFASPSRLHSRIPPL